MAVKRSDFSKIPTAQLQADYKANCKAFKELNALCALQRAELVSRQDIADAEAKLKAAQDAHEQALKGGE